jgi:prefoldin subunit 5
MKKGLISILILIVLATIVAAQEDTAAPTVPRMTNFMGDNIHIIRVQELSEKLDGQITTLDTKLAELETKLNELETIKSNMGKPMEISTTGYAAQLEIINSQMQDIKTSVNDLNEVKNELQAKPEPVKKDSTAIYLVGLLAVNAVLLVATIFTFTSRKPKEKQIKTVHEYIAQSLDSGVDEHEIKQELLTKGWSTKDIEKVFSEIQ